MLDFLMNLYVSNMVAYQSGFNLFPVREFMDYTMALTDSVLSQANRR